MKKAAIKSKQTGSPPFSNTLARRKSLCRSTDGRVLQYRSVFATTGRMRYRKKFSSRKRGQGCSSPISLMHHPDIHQLARRGGQLLSSFRNIPVCGFLPNSRDQKSGFVHVSSCRDNTAACWLELAFSNLAQSLPLLSYPSQGLSRGHGPFMRFIGEDHGLCH